MKLSRCKKKLEQSSTAMIVAVSIACSAYVQQADAGVTWLVSEVGEDLVFVTDGGSLRVPATSGTFSASNSYGQIYESGIMPNVTNRWYQDMDSGTVSGNAAWIIPGMTVASNYSGHTFMYSTSNLYWDSRLGSNPGSITPLTSMTFSDKNIAEAFGTNLDSGPVVLWTHDITGDTISIARAVPIPEPTSTSLLSLVGLGLILRRRNRKKDH